MFTNKKFFSIAFLAAIASAPLLLRADTPGKHPSYIHARADLRSTQWLLRVNDDPDVMHRVHEADQEIEKAIFELDKACQLDKKDINDHPAIDANLDRPGRFRKTLELLRRARVDIDRQEDDPSAVGWRNLAYQHIDKAIEYVKHAARDLHMEKQMGW